MKHVNAMRVLGIICICSAAASFLYEGWGNFNGLEKYLIFFGFITTLFGLGEVFKKYSESLGSIFYGLFLALSSAITAQLASFIIDGDPSIHLPSFFSPSPLPDGSPLKFICITSAIFLIAMMYRASQRLHSSHSIGDMVYFITAQSLLLVPVRTGDFHALALLSMCISFMLIDKHITFQKLNPLANKLIRLAPFIFLFGRASLYGSSTLLEISQCLIISFATFIYVPLHVKNSSIRNISYAAGYINLIIMGHLFGQFKLWTEYEWTLLVVETLLIIYLITFKLSFKIGFFFVGILAWFSFLQMLVSSHDLTLLKISLNIALPLALIVLSYSFKYAFGFAQSGLLFICVLTYVGYKVITFPMVNMWMIFGVLGIALLLVSFLIERPHQKLIDLMSKTKKFFNEEL